MPVNRTEILANIENPRQLEMLYREDKSTFRKVFNMIYPEIREKATARFWHERLSHESGSLSRGNKTDLLFVGGASLLAALLSKLPAIFSIDEEFFYPRNLSFIAFPFIAFYFAWKHKTGKNILAGLGIIFFGSAIYINSLPHNIHSDTLTLACVHLLFMLWAAVGVSFTGSWFNHEKRLEFLRYNGDLIVMMALLLISGGILAGITMGLFDLIQINIEEFYMQYIIVCGLAAVPIIGTWLVRTNPSLVGKVSPVIARIFTPLVLITLIAYLIAVVYTGKDPYTDREFLIIFNVVLAGVMAMILFSVAEASENPQWQAEKYLLPVLSLVTIVVNCIALSAILFRVSEWGITPNRAAVLGSNVLMLVNLLMISFRLWKSVKDPSQTALVEKSIGLYLPVYVLWSAVVVFGFPAFFGFR